MQLARSSTSTTDPRAAGSTRRSASVASSAPDSSTAAAICSRLRKPPVPTMRREPKSRPAIVSGASATLHRLHDLDTLALAQLQPVPVAARDHLAVHGHREPARVRLGPAGGHGLAHPRAVVQVAPLAVERHVHAVLPAMAKRSGPNGA